MMSSKEAVQGEIVGQNAMERQRDHADNRQFCTSTSQREKEMDCFGRNIWVDKAQLDHGGFMNREEWGWFDYKTYPNETGTQSQIFPDFLHMNTTEKHSNDEVSVRQNTDSQRILLQKQSTPYFSALETFSDWLYEWTPPEKIIPKLKMIGQMRKGIVRGWLDSVNIQRPVPVPLHANGKRKNFGKKDASVQTEDDLQETTQITRNHCTRIKKWLQTCFQRSKHSCRTIFCTSKGEINVESQKNDESKDSRCGYPAANEVEALKDLSCNDIKRSSTNNSFAYVAEISQDKIKISEKSSDLKHSASIKDLTEEDAQSTTTYVDKSLCNLRDIDGPSLVCFNDIIKLTGDDATDRKYWKDSKVNERKSRRKEGTASDVHENNLKINQNDFQSNKTPRFNTFSIFEEDEKIDDDIGRDDDLDENVDLSVAFKRKMYSTDSVPKTTGNVHLSSMNNKIIPKLEKARVNVLKLSRSFRSKIQDIDSLSCSDRQVGTTEMGSLLGILSLKSTDNAQATKFCAQRRLRDTKPASKSRVMSSFRNRLSDKLYDNNKVHPRSLGYHLERSKNETKGESLDKKELQGMTEFIETMLQRDKPTNPDMEVRELLHRQRELDSRMANPCTFLPCHRLELSFRETLRQKYAHHNHFKTETLSKRPDSRQGCIGCQLVVSSELYGNSQKCIPKDTI